MSQNVVIIIAGPTASGKSQLAIDIANEVSGVIVNADSMQVYKDTPILSACPSLEDKSKIEHCLYEIYDSSNSGNVFDWLELAVAEIKRIWSENKIPVVVGGTGLYIDNLINGTTPIPATPAHIRDKVARSLERLGLAKLHEKLIEVDPQTAQKLSPNDVTRICRAWEVFSDTGIPISQWHQMPMQKKLEEAKFVVVKILPTKLELDERCFLRFDMMLNAGALQEVEKLATLNLNRNLPAMKALGVPELLDYLDGKTSLEEAVELGKIHTRQYAKRQKTWFANKLNADITLNECYTGQKIVVNNVKKAL